MVVNIEKELQRYLIKIDSRVFEEMDSSGFDYSSINYISLKNVIKNNPKIGKTLPLLMYSISENAVFSDDFYKMIKIYKFEITHNLTVFIKLFREFREEKALIKSIRFKAEIIHTSGNKDEWSLLDKIGRVLVLQEGDP